MVFNLLWETVPTAARPAGGALAGEPYDWFGSLAFQPLGLAIVGPIAAGIGSGRRC
jgi:hypothetical protein